MDPFTAAAIGSTVGNVATSAFGSLFGRKRPKVPPQLGQIAREVHAMAQNLPDAPEELLKIAEKLNMGASMYDLPPEEIAQIASLFDGSRVSASAGQFDALGQLTDKVNPELARLGEQFAGAAEHQGNQALDAAALANADYLQNYRPVEAMSTHDAMNAGTPGAVALRRDVAGGTARSAVADAQAQALDAARRRGAAPTLNAAVSPTATAAAADVIASQAYNAGEAERRLGFNLRQNLLPHAEAMSNRSVQRGAQGINFGHQASNLRENGVASGARLANMVQAGQHGAVDLAGGVQQLHGTEFDANNIATRNRLEAMRNAQSAYLTDHNAKLDTTARRAQLSNQAFGHFRGKHNADTNYWSGRRSDIQGGIGAVIGGANRLFGGFGGGNTPGASSRGRVNYYPPNAGG